MEPVFHKKEKPINKTAADYIESGNNFLSSGDIDKAIEEYTQAIRLDPNNLNAYMSRGDAYRLSP